LQLELLLWQLLLLDDYWLREHQLLLQPRLLY
jgi:hypothetical protein